MPRLFRRREILWPTFPGWLLLFAIFATLGLLLVRHAYDFLAVTAPAENARLLVVEGWLSESELDAAVEIFEAGNYTGVAVTGGPLDGWASNHGYASYAELAADYLRAHGLAQEPVYVVPAPASAQDRTFLTAVALRDWLESGVRVDTALDVVSSGTHARRSWRLFRAALGPEIEVGIFAVQPTGYDAGRWWRSSAGVKSVLGESIGLAWTICCFRAPARGSHEERWGQPRATE